MGVKFCPIASGSSGNSIYLGTDFTHILIDAGLSGKKIVEGLNELQVPGEKLDALFITHEHTDHIKGAGIISRRFDIPIYATMGTWEAMEGELGAIAPKNRRYVYAGENCVINDIRVKPFEIPHDAREPVAYNIFTENHKITVATDIGHITDLVKESAADSEILLLESNHDVDMLKNGRYSWPLKKRILGDHGHISNHAAGELLGQIMSGKMKYVYLGHLSDENNRPHLAYETVANILDQYKIKVGSHIKLDLAARYSISKLTEL